MVKSTLNYQVKISSPTFNLRQGDIYQWLRRIESGKWVHQHWLSNVGSNQVFAFANSQDALLFKLTWQK